MDILHDKNIKLLQTIFLQVNVNQMIRDHQRKYQKLRSSY